MKPRIAALVSSFRPGYNRGQYIERRADLFYVFSRLHFFVKSPLGALKKILLLSAALSFIVKKCFSEIRSGRKGNRTFFAFYTS